MSEMVERVARAIFEAEGWPPKNWLTIPERGEEGREHYRENASAAITAMREPTPEMVAAAPNLVGWMAKKDWQAMIDEALK